MLIKRCYIVLLFVTLMVSGITYSPAARADYMSWLNEFQKQARQSGISETILNESFRSFEPIERVIELDRRQPEGRLTFAEYKKRVINNHRISTGRKMLRKHRDVLARVEKRYGVPAEVIVALWGIESDFGQFKGRFSVIHSLATLAYDGRRAKFFTNELISALKILQNGDIQSDQMFGSWAGAMGQSQFMPSTYLGYAVDGDGDGKRDIWNNLEDTFSSMANYLNSIGWNDQYIWGRQVKAPQSLVSQAGLDDGRLIQAWQNKGVRRSNGTDLPNVPIKSWLIMHDDGNGPHYLVYNNFKVLMRWNRSTYFATSVGLLADAIRS